VHNRSLSAEEVQGRWGILFVVFGVHVGMLLIVESSVRSGPQERVNSPVMLWLQLTAPNPRILAPARSRVRPPRAIGNSVANSPPAPVAFSGAITASSPSAMTAAPSIALSPPPDWHAQARQSANAVLAAEAIAQRRGSTIGTTPFSNFDASARGAPSRPSFPWSRQPLSRAFDFDPDTFEVTLYLGKRCRLSYFLFVVGFGCVLGPINPEPGRGDLFDPKFRSAPIELPVPLMAQPVQ
jgi:hypothetical protein